MTLSEDFIEQAYKESLGHVHVRDRKAAMRALAQIGATLQSIDAEIAELGEKLERGEIFPTLVLVKENNLKARRAVNQRAFNALSAAIPSV